VITDGFVRARTYRTRVRLAMAHAPAATSAGTGEPLQLLLAAADAARSDTSLRDTIRAAPELATLHADPSAVADALLHTTSAPWRGKLHLRAAFVLAVHDERRSEAAEQLDLAQAWLRAWSRDPDRRTWDFDADDLAHGAVAALLLGQRELAWKLATGWRPVSFAASVVERLIALAPGAVSWQQFTGELDAGRASTVVKAQAAVSYARAGVPVPAGYWRALARRLAQAPARTSGPWITEFGQFALEAGVGRSIVRRILQPRVPQMGHLDSWQAAERLLPYLHNRVLCALLAGRTPDPATLRPAHLSNPDQPRSDGQARIYDQIAPDLIALLTADAHQSLARSETEALAAAEQALQLVQQLVQRLRSGAAHRFPERAGSRRGLLRRALLVAADALATLEHRSGGLPSTATIALGEVVDALPQILPDTVPSLLLDLAGRLRTRGAAEQLSDALIRQAAAAAEAAASPPSERRDLLLRAARVALDGGSGDGPVMSADLFDRAVVVASSLDVDIAARLRCLLQLAAVEQEQEQDEELARRLLEAVEAASAKVDDPDEQLPHTLALQVATALAPTVGLPAAMRWADEDRLTLDAALAAAVPAATRFGPLDLDQALTLLGMRQPELVSVRLLRATAGVLPAGADTRAVITRRLRSWAAQVTTNADGAGSAAEAAALRGWIDDDSLDADELSRELLAFERSRASEPPSQPATRSWDTPRSKVDVDAVVGAASQSQAQEHLALLRSGYASEEVLGRYLGALALREQGGRVSTLTFLAGLADAGSGCPARVVAPVLARLLEQWRTSPSVISWARQTLPDWTARHLPALFDHVYEPGEYPRPTLRLPSHDTVVRERTWTELARQLDQFSPDQLFAAAVDLGRADISSTGRRLAVRWALEQAQPSQPRPAPPEPAPAAVGTRVLLAGLGHEDVRRRWLAARAVREHLLLTGDIGLAEQLLALATAGPADVVADCELPGAMPRPLTALQWLLTALSQVAVQDASLLRPLAGALHGIACDSALPHATIRELARRAAVPLMTADPVAAAELALANRPRRASVAERSWDRDDERDAGSARFHFSAMDTLPYWFAPLARVFHGINTAEVTQRCDAWVSDRWRRSWDGDCKLDPRALRRSENYMLISNDHGSLPTIETAESYLEYHAMMLVAGELADTGEVERPAFRGSGDPWLEWLDGYLPTQPWIAVDRRPVRAAAVALGDGLRLRAADRGCDDRGGAVVGDGAAIAGTAARDAVRLDVGEHEIIVRSSVHGSCDGFSYSAWTESALVNPEAVATLIAALGHSGELPPLPYLDDEGPPWGKEITLPSLTLRGWLRRRTVTASSIDAADPAGFGPGPPDRVEPSTQFTAHADAAPGGGWRRVAWAALAYERPDRHQESDPRSGDFTAVDRTALVAFLASQRMCLLLEASSRVHPPRLSGAKEERMLYEANYRRLLWPDGREEELHGSARSHPLRF
jgi:hypothetical protein